MLIGQPTYGYPQVGLILPNLCLATFQLKLNSRTLSLWEPAIRFNCFGNSYQQLYNTKYCEFISVKNHCIEDLEEPLHGHND